jgi:hypothetical protein
MSRTKDLRTENRGIRPAFALSIALLLLVHIPSSNYAQATFIPMVPDRWIVGEKNERIEKGQSLEHNGKFVVYRGHESLRLAKGFAYVRNLEFQNGSIEADMALDSVGLFAGIAFRVQSEDEYELVFFRNGSAGTREAIQYTPGFLGANAWQIYNIPKYAGVGNFPTGEWFHIKVVVAGLVAKVYLGNNPNPVLNIADLKQGYSKGSIGFWGHVGGGYLSNVSYVIDTATYESNVRENFSSDALTNWELSDSFDVVDKDPAVYPDIRTMKWEMVRAESPGMVVIQRYRRDPNIAPPAEQGIVPVRVPGSKVVFARTTIHSEKNEIRRMNFGYSDQVVVYLNSQPIYAGNNSYRSREPGFLGLVSVNSDAVFLHLKKGDNELLLAVSEVFGGWGFMCKLAE